ncbi:MAG: peptide chain release factor aRF-1 [Nitrososphaerota archaeon]|nr:peptide chain release factor aRF-1 [Nitrososphaerota archaeon]MDG6958526.1 peptide chain release factor aRF-1 [Nitrososphaerota archaeon]MDG6965905.1 peptide chain release factor aRF-1 [Nitrososphaerota archaeon]
MSKTDSVRLYKVRKLISELSSKEGRGTELVSLYIPPKKAIHEAIANLREEWGTAGNIKSDTTRNHVQDALTKAMQRLKLYRTVPDMGLVVFSGALPTNGPGSEVVNVWEIIPPKPVQTYLYACDDHFRVEYLRDMLREDKVFGLLVIDSSDVGLGILSGGSLEIVDLMTSGISGKTRKGGQSARRYERGREMELTYFFNRVAEHATRTFVDGNKVTGLIVGGPGPTKDDFLKGGYLHYELQKKVIAVLDLGYSGREGVRELVEKASDILKDVRLVEEKRLVQKFLGEVNRQGGLAVYGLPRVLDALQKASTEVVLVSDDLEMVKIEATCKKCGAPKSQTVPSSKKIQSRQDMGATPCANCGATDYEFSEKDLVDVLEEMAFQAGSKVEVISSGTEEGSMFKTFGGIAALLRYRA